VTPLCFGVVVGAISSGAVGQAATRAVTGGGGGSFTEVYVEPWLAVYPLVVGFFALALFAMLAAVYLAHAARDDALREDFRRRALVAAVIVGVVAGVSLLVSASSAPRIARGVTASPWALFLHVDTAIAAITGIAALWWRRYRLARVAVAVQVTLILWGWALAQYPFVIPLTLTIRQSAAPDETLELLLVGLAGGALILIPSLRLLFKTFSPMREPSARG
jgi:cytochrome d ubiquinol oxidase subunit II